MFDQRRFSTRLSEVSLTPEGTDEQLGVAQLLLEYAVCKALQAIERDYPRYVRMIFKERR